MAIGAIIAVGAGLLSAFGKKKAGDSAKKAAQLSAKVIRKRTEVDVTVAERLALKGLGQTRADVGAAGLAQAGSAADLIRESERDAAFAITTLKEQGKLEEKAVLAGGQAAQTAGNIGAASSVLGGIARGFGF